MMTNDPMKCAQCTDSLPAEASFCPHCGADTVPRLQPFNAVRMQALVGNTGSLPKDDPLDTVEIRPGRAHGHKWLAGVAVATAVVLGIGAGTWLANAVNRPADRFETVPQATVEAEIAPASIDVEVVSNARGGFDLKRGNRLLFTATSSTGSRYGNLDERMRSIAVRLQHAESKGQGAFETRTEDNRTELFWVGTGGELLILQVTDVDARDSDVEVVAGQLARSLNESHGPTPNA